MPPLGVARELPLDEQETSYFAAADKILSLLCTESQYTLEQLI
jgi:hypothetical protein